MQALHSSLVYAAGCTGQTWAWWSRRICWASSERCCRREASTSTDSVSSRSVSGGWRRLCGSTGCQLCSYTLYSCTYGDIRTSPAPCAVSALLRRTTMLYEKSRTTLCECESVRVHFEAVLVDCLVNFSLCQFHTTSRFCIMLIAVFFWKVTFACLLLFGPKHANISNRIQYDGLF